MGAEMKTRLKINELKNEIKSIKATFRARPVTGLDDARVARINEINAEVRELSYLLSWVVVMLCKYYNNYYNYW